MKRISYDASLCVGCRICELTCSFAKEGVFAPSISRIIVTKDDIHGLDVPNVCWHCTPCKAMESCPQEALERNNDGLVIVREEKCVGCEKCSEACVLRAIRLHPKKNIAQICDQCGGQPLCVQKCPTQALTYVETEERQPESPDVVAKETLRRWGISA